MTAYSYVIVGGGMTAQAAMQGIRERDPDGAIGMFTGEPHRPYQRPPLSKGLWKDAEESSIFYETPSGVDVQAGRLITKIDVGSRTVHDDAGGTHQYQKLLLATGGTPRRFPHDDDRVIYFRTLDDYRALRARATPGAHVAVVGGGFIGSEIAAALAMNECRVSLLFPDAGLGARIFPPDLGRYLADYFRERGVTVRPGVQVSGVSGNGDGAVVHLDGGDDVQADAVVAGIGILPSVGLAEEAGLQVDNGIVVDEQLCAGPAGVFAAGDVAAFWQAALGTRRRVEHEDNAVQMGAAAGRNMAGAGESYTHLPLFYSDLFDLGYEAVGECDARMEVVTDWKEPFREGVLYYLRDGRVRGVVLWNVWGQSDAARALIGEGKEVDARALQGRLG